MSTTTTTTTLPSLSTTVLRHNRRQLNHLPQLTTEENSPHLLQWHYSNFDDDDRTFQINAQTLLYIFILFSIILLVTLLLLYARWFFRFRHLHSTHAHALHQARGGFRMGSGMDPIAIKELPIILHQESPAETEDEMECCICLGVFQDGDKVKVLPKCRHRFHSDCVDRWLLTQSSCPLCRVSLRVDSPIPPV